MDSYSNFSLPLNFGKMSLDFDAFSCLSSLRIARVKTFTSSSKVVSGFLQQSQLNLSKLLTLQVYAR